MHPADDLYAVIPAGGSGTRLWPLSREHRPKFLHPLTGTDRSLLQATADRLRPLVAPDHLYVVTGTAHAAAVARQLPEVPERNILVEPSPRDSAAAIALATELIEQRAPGAVVASFAADHLIRDPDAFCRTVLAAVEGARAGKLMTIGITPTGPDTGFGYLECTASLAPLTRQPVRSFREKPPVEVAREYVDSGRYLWNASMFTWQARVFLDELGRRRPDVAVPVREIAAAWDTPAGQSTLADLWPTVAKVAVDYAVMEPAAADGLVATVPGDFGWSDIGDFETLARLLGSDEGAALVIELTGESLLAKSRPSGAGPRAAGQRTSPTGSEGDSPLVSLDSDGLVVLPASGRLIATLDVHDLIIVDVEDAVLVCRRDRAQDIKKLTELLRERGAKSYV